MDMKFDTMMYLVMLILGMLVAILPWTAFPVCMTEMRCWITRDVETVLGAVIAVMSLIGAYKSLGVQ